MSSVDGIVCLTWMWKREEANELQKRRQASSQGYWHIDLWFSHKRASCALEIVNLCMQEHQVEWTMLYVNGCKIPNEKITRDKKNQKGIREELTCMLGWIERK